MLPAHTHASHYLVLIALARSNVYTFSLQLFFVTGRSYGTDVTCLWYKSRADVYQAIPFFSIKHWKTGSGLGTRLVCLHVSQSKVTSLATLSIVPRSTKELDLEKKSFCTMCIFDVRVLHPPHQILALLFVSAPKCRDTVLAMYDRGTYVRRHEYHHQRITHVHKIQGHTSTKTDSSNIASQTRQQSAIRKIA